MVRCPLDTVARNFQVPAVKYHKNFSYNYHWSLMKIKIQISDDRVTEKRLRARLRNWPIKKLDKKIKRCTPSEKVETRESCVRPVSYTRGAPHHSPKRWCSIWSILEQYYQDESQIGIRQSGWNKNKRDKYHHTHGNSNHKFIIHKVKHASHSMNSQDNHN